MLRLMYLVHFALLAAIVISAPAQGQSGIGLQVAKITSPSPTDKAFGDRVAADGNTAVITAGIVQGQMGKAVVFVREGTAWTQQEALVGTEMSQSGWASDVALSGNTAIVGDVQHKGLTIGTPIGPGNAHVFVRQGLNWIEQAVLAPSDGLIGDDFGRSLAIDGDIAVIGAYYSGKAYIFRRNGTSWNQERILSGSTGYHFGETVAVDGSVVAVGTPQNHTLALYGSLGGSWLLMQTIPSPTGNNDGFGRSISLDGGTLGIGAYHAAYVYIEDGASWTLQQSILPVPANTDFGARVIVSDDADLLLVGDPQAVNDQGSLTGAMFVYSRVGTTWSVLDTLLAADGGDDDGFGRAAAIAGNSALVGATHADIGGTANAGATYVFEPLQSWSGLGGGLAGLSGVPPLKGTGYLEPGTSGALMLTDAAPFALSVLFASFDNTPTPFKGGVFSASPIVFQLPVSTLFGSWTLPWTAWPSGIPTGFELYFQVAVSDAGAPQGVAISNLLEATLP